MKKGAIWFAISGAVFTIAFFVAVNYIFSPGVLWFIYPVFAVLWWPIGVYFGMRKKYLALAITGSLLTIAFLAAVNFITSPGVLWFVYAVPALLCWPIGVYLNRKMASLTVAIIFSLVLAASYIVMNLLLSPGFLWCIYPSYFLLWWPLLMYFKSRGKQKVLSIVGASANIIFFIAANLLNNSGYPWALYACWPLIWWPLATYLVRLLGALRFSIICATCTVLWYGALNIFLAPPVPWIIFIIYPVLWLPFSVYFYSKGHKRWYAAVMMAISILFFVAVNLIFSPRAVWAIYPAFALLWWPTTLFFAHLKNYKKWFWYSVAASALLIVFFMSVNFITSPGYPWSVYPSLAVLWWPLAAYFKKHKSAAWFSISGSLLIIGTLLVINLLTSPGFLWSMFPLAVVLWWPVSVFFAKRGQPFILSLCGVLLIALLLGLINLMTYPGFLWFLIPVFVALWWPVGVFFFKRRRRFSGGKTIAALKLGKH